MNCHCSAGGDPGLRINSGSFNSAFMSSPSRNAWGFVSRSAIEPSPYAFRICASNNSIKTLIYHFEVNARPDSLDTIS